MRGLGAPASIGGVTRLSLNPVDTIWWRADRAANLMVIEALVRLDGPVDRDRLADLLRRRVVDRYPVFARRAQAHRFPGARPRWVPVPGFRVEDHLRHVVLPDADDAALQEYVAGFLGVPLDPARPLWEIHVVEGHPAGAVLYARLHHAMADGIALTRVLLSITDEQPDADPADAPGAAPGAAGAGTGRGTLPAAVRDAGRVLPSVLPAVLPAVLRTVPVLAKLLLTRTPPSALDAGPGGTTPAKRVVWSRAVPLGEVKDLARRTGTTVNDVLLCALAGALERYQARHGAAPVDLTTMVPVNLRPLDRPLPARLGNRFAVVLLRLPSGPRGALDRLAETRRRMDTIKASPEPVVTFALLHLIGSAGTRLGGALVRFFGRKAVGVTTNVPGPREPRYLAGTRITSLLGWVPGTGDQTLGTCIFSYAGSVLVGFKTDAVAVPDPEEVLAGFHAELDALMDAAGVPRDPDARDRRADAAPALVGLP